MGIVNQAYFEGTWGTSPRTASLPFTHTAGNGLLIICSGSASPTGVGVTGATLVGSAGAEFGLYIPDPTSAISSLEMTFTGGGSTIPQFGVVEVEGPIDPDEIVFGTATTTNGFGRTFTFNITAATVDDIALVISPISFGGAPLLSAVNFVGGLVSIKPGTSDFSYPYFSKDGFTTTGANQVGYNWDVADGGAISDHSPAWLIYSPTASSGPVLSSASVTSITTVGATVNYSTDTAGTAYIVKTTSATVPSAAQIKAGQDHTGAAAVYATSASVASGARSFTTSGGSASTLYYWYVILNDGSADSNVLNGSFTTSAAVGATHPFTSVNIGG
jgi:hypothetical protein